jgi:outer membrane protein assembly factor BamA
MSRSTFSVLLAGLFLPFALPVAGQQFQPKTIQFKGDPEYSVKELMDASGLKSGALLTSAEMNDHSKRLMDTGVFDNLTYKFDGQDLVYLLKPSTQMYPIRLENLPLTPGADLDARLHSLLPLYHGKVPAEGTLQDDVRKQLEGLLAAQGITTTLVTVPYSDRKTAPKKGAVTAISFTIAQPPVTVGAIHLEGVSPNLAARLAPIIKDVSEQAFDSSNSTANVENAFRFFYEDQGYAAVKVTAARSGDPVISETAIQVPFSVTVKEGRQYKLGDIQLPPGTPVEKADIDKILNKPVAGALPGVGLRSVWSLIAQRYRSKGYLDVVISPHGQIDESAGVVNYTVDINPGQVYHLAFIKFDNVSDDLRKLLMRNWQLMPGDPFDQAYVSTFLIKAQLEDPVLRKTLVGVKPTFDVMADPQTHDVNLVIRLNRQP